jgi:hypothetical protein
MKIYVFNYKDSEGNEKEVALRLTSLDCENIEKQYNCTLIDFIQQASVTSIVTLLMYMRKGAGENFTKNMTYGFYDELVDAGYTMTDILDKIIWEGLVVSGVMSAEDLANLRAERKKVEEMTDEERAELVKERKNAQK